MNKKASSILMIIFELLAVILIIWITTEVAYGMGKSDTVVKVNLATDLKMMVNTLAGVSGDVVIEYPLNVVNYTFTLSQNSVSVFKKTESDQQKVTRTFILPTGYFASGSLDEKSRLCLEKKDKNIF